MPTTDVIEQTAAIAARGRVRETAANAEQRLDQATEDFRRE